jgi:UDPglucose 6-dehydrogenase
LHEVRAAGLDTGGASFGTCRSGTYVPGTLPNTPAFWRIMGLFAAEGWVSLDYGRDDAERLRVCWSFHPTNEEDLVDEVVEFWRGLGVEARVYSPPTSRKVQVSSRVLAHWLLRDLGAGGDCYDKRVPDALWSCPNEHKDAYLSGLWRGDGSWSFVANRRGVVFEYGTVAPRLADGILRLLAERDIVASWKIGRPPGSTVATHFVRVSGAAQVERLLSFAPEAERTRILASIDQQSKRIAPTGWRAQADSARVRVTRVERERFAGFVYSLEVPAARTFVTTGGLVVHNCFPKDIRALTHTARGHGVELAVVEAAERANERQKRVLGARVRAHFGGASMTGKRVAVWGLAFKPETDDVRESPALSVIDDVLSAGAEVVAYDPAAADTARGLLGDRISYAGDMYAAAEGADALVLVTEWKAFRRPDFARLKDAMRTAAVFDGRNIWSPVELRELGFTYYGIGRP